MKKETEVIIDDHTGEELDKSSAVRVKLKLDNEEWYIDGSRDTIKALRESIRPFVKSADRVPKKITPQQNRRPGRTGRNTAAREWAAKKGIEVSRRGQISKDVLLMFYQENPEWRKES